MQKTMAISGTVTGAMLLGLAMGLWAAPPTARGQDAAAECPDVVPPVDQRGEQLFTDFCWRCNQAEDLARHIQGAGDPEAAASNMVAFLARHGSCDPAADEAIVRYLSTLAR